MRHLRRATAVLVFCALLALAYLLAGALQVTAFHHLGGTGVARMAYERMPWALLLSPVLPALSLDNLLRLPGPSTALEFMVFLVPFALLAAAAWRIARRLARAPGA